MGTADNFEAQIPEVFQLIRSSRCDETHAARSNSDMKMFRWCLMFVSAALCLGRCPSASCAGASSFSQFVQDRSERHFTNVPHEVLALYYCWYGQPQGSWGDVDINKHEISKTVRYPVKGAYSSQDAAVIGWQIDQAKAHGITGFVASWWGKSDSWGDKAFQTLLKCAEEKGFKISIYWEQERDTAGLMVQFAVDDLTYVLEKYGKSSAFLKVDGKPVIFAYEHIESQTPLSTLGEIVQKVRAKSGDFVLIGQGYQESLAYIFDGLHTGYGNMHLNLLTGASPDRLEEFRGNAANCFEKGRRIARAHGRIVCPMVVPGFENSKKSPGHFVADRYDGQTYRGLWEDAIKTRPDWVLISSWNEWLEGTEIEPSLQFSEKYLQITAEYSRRFLGSPAVAGSPSVTPPTRFSFQTANDANGIPAGTTVGLLMTTDYYDPEFWAAYGGAKTQRLTWSDLINRDGFNAKKFPILVYVGGEHFVSSIKTSDDVTSALIRYLHEGGFLVVLPVDGVWPFYYDQSRGDKPMPITDRLGLGLTGAGNWDSPPAGVSLTFYFNTSVLPGLPGTAPYPTTGDRRFRPSNRSGASPSDSYVPLVQLWDGAHRFRGDAAVFVQHKTLPLSPGKTVYISQRVPEALGPNEFFPALFQFISTKLERAP
jgi:glycoprotein endo-alpha-1,2-mannosidase